MKEELNKFLYFLKEAEKTSATPPRQRLNRDFYEIWETVQKPKPFFYDNPHISFLGREFLLIEETTPRVATFTWDESEQCPALIIEGREWRDKILFIIDSGDIEIIQKEPEFLDEMGISTGEKLEIIFDIIYHHRKVNPELDIFSLKKSNYTDALNAISSNYNKRIIRVMKKLSLSSVKRLIKKAAEDIPHDELSQQMHLPLNGVYVNSENEHNSHAKQEKRRFSLDKSYIIPKENSWKIEQNLFLLASAMKSASFVEDSTVISLKNIEIIHSKNDHIIIKVPLPEEITLTESSILNIHSISGQQKVGTIKIDIFENNAFIGRVRFFSNFNIEDIRQGKLFAKLRTSPFAFLAVGMEKIFNDFKTNKLSPLLKQLLGQKILQYKEPGIPENPSDKLEISQIQAKKAAINDDIPVVLIQGPPGTGKTTVLIETAMELCREGKRILITAPSHTAVDNICRKLTDIPILRFGKNPSSIAPDIIEKYWIGKELNVVNFVEKRKKFDGGGIYTGTHVGLMKDSIIQDEVYKNGFFDVIIFDEAGMAATSEFFILASMCRKTVLFGDHKQLPPYPLSDTVKKILDNEIGPRLKSSDALINLSSMEYLAEYRKFPIITLTKSFRCQNPRLIRFSSIMFYDALVTASRQAEYFALSYFERKKVYPPDTLKLISTSALPDKIKNETFSIKGGKPGISNQCEGLIVINTVYMMLTKYPLNEITVISPYKAQTKLIRSILQSDTAAGILKKNISEKEWKKFLFTRISTVDSFQGGESDAVIISYVRSNKDNSLGFTDNHNRINVAHTRCRKEMIIIGDIECLKKGADNPIFERLERSIKRDGKIIEIDIKALKQLQKNITDPENIDFSSINSIEFFETENETEILKINSIQPELKTPEKLKPATKKVSDKSKTPESVEELKKEQKLTAPEIPAELHSEVKENQSVSTENDSENVIINVSAETDTNTTIESEQNTETDRLEEETSTLQYIEIPGMAQPDLF
jgi:DNA polymerase III delta prime subunit